MVDFVLNYLRGPTGKGFYASLKLSSLPLNFDRLIAFAWSWTAEQGKTTFLSVIRLRLFDNLRIKHRHICALVIKYNNALSHTNHIRCHTNATLTVRNKRIQQILRHLQIFFCRHLRLSRKKYRIVYYFFYHIALSHLRYNHEFLR